ncbi:MAG: branched-chain amino acid transporter permease [Clostridia bacterium]|nr:branched-chain amino acid transporter permease [Clostridia bacterium]
MTVAQQIITIFICAFATMITRFTPFVVFNSKKPTPKFIQYLGKALPAAIFGMLVVYCLKNVEIVTGAHAIPEVISIILITLVHKWKRNMLLSIGAGTACYMLLVQFVF